MCVDEPLVGEGPSINIRVYGGKVVTQFTHKRQVEIFVGVRDYVMSQRQV
jgi:hypothetical protein